MARWAATLFALSLLLPVAACSARQRNCVPPSWTSQRQQLLDVHADPSERNVFEASTFQALLAGNRGGQDDCDATPAHRPINVLALSGGGSYGSFIAGYLNGWSATRTRPTFNVVTGVSTGALIATSAFLGPEFDESLRVFYTRTTTKDVIRRKNIVSALLSDSIGSSKPLEAMIERTITPQIVEAVAQAYACGRRLYIGTTNLDTHRLVIWDMGAIAASNRPDSVTLFRKILLASASPPGALPPVPFEIQVNGRTFTELHADGGTTSQIFVRAGTLPIHEQDFRDGKKVLRGSNLYVIVAGKLYADPQCTQEKLRSITGSAITSFTYTQTRHDLVRIYLLCALTGMQFNLASLDQNYELDFESLEFEPEKMKKLFNEGYRMASRNRWRHTPPGLEKSEQITPRAGTDFILMSPSDISRVH